MVAGSICHCCENIRHMSNDLSRNDLKWLAIIYVPASLILQWLLQKKSLQFFFVDYSLIPEGQFIFAFFLDNNFHDFIWKKQQSSFMENDRYFEDRNIIGI